MIATIVNHSETWTKVTTGATLESGAGTREGINLYDFLNDCYWPKADGRVREFPVV
jgi:hypothetical protein